MMKSLLILFTVASAALFTPSKSQAALYHLELEGEIDLVTFAFSDTVSPGQMAHFSLVFDTDALDTNPSPTAGWFAGAIEGQVTGLFGDATYTTTSTSRFSTGGDVTSSLGYTGFGGSIPDLNGLERTGVITFDLRSSDPSAVSANMLPTSLDLNDFDLARNFLFVAPSGGISGTINSVSVTAVPLPASGLLLIGALGLVLIRRRRTA